MDLIVFTHPDNQGSHNAAVLRHVQARLKACGKPFETIDLYADRFDPVLRYGPDGDPLPKKYQSQISKAQRVIFIYPVWWSHAPAMLEGFFDKVLMAPFAFEFKDASRPPGFVLALLNVLAGLPLIDRVLESVMPIERKMKGKTAVVIRTHGGIPLSSTIYRHAERQSVDSGTLRFCGFDVRAVEWWDVDPKGAGREIPVRVKAQIDRVLA